MVVKAFCNAVLNVSEITPGSVGSLAAFWSCHQALSDPMGKRTVTVVPLPSALAIEIDP